MENNQSMDFARRWRLDNRRALVTGGTKGIGQAVAHELLMLGATVAIVARDPAQVNEQVAEWHQAGLAHAYGIAADVAQDAGRQAAIAYVIDTMGGLDILINNVGTNIRKATTEYAESEVATLFTTNLTSAWEMSRLAHPYLVAAKDQDGGSIVHIGSVAGTRFVGSGAPYAMTKAALDQLTRYLAVEWARVGIRTNCVNPWYTETPLAASVLANEAFRERVLAATPLGRIADPPDVAALVAFLCLPAARHITGQTVAVDGGFLAKGL